ncbi:hypothetical protein [Jiulongibacter sediminis]|uniref:hypothetical protein n=1 Tax=Jiulongibacter sediminis TaxID=1605367 RepID=UPI0013F15ADC|nr:hypothetical protein [Jiulongibacter sediminis]
MQKLNKPLPVLLGLILGATIGFFTENIALWLSLGLALGAGIYSVKKNEPENETK